MSEMSFEERGSVAILGADCFHGPFRRAFAAHFRLRDVHVRRPSFERFGGGQVDILGDVFRLRGEDEAE